MPSLVHLILLFLALPSYCLATIESKDFDGLLNQRQTRAGLNATKTASKALADKHFDLHGAKWPSRAFVQAVKEATLVVAAGASTPPLHATSSLPHDALPRRLVLMAMANELAMRVTVPEFVRSLDRAKTGIGGGSGGNSLASHLLLVCSSEGAAELCRGLGLGSRQDGGAGAAVICHHTATGSGTD